MPYSLHASNSVVGTDYIRPHKCLRIGNGAVYMALRRKIHNHIRLLIFEKFEDELSVRNIPLTNL